MDYIGKYVKRFESGSRGSLALGSSGNDWGLSCGSYQLTLRWGNCINFLTEHFPEESRGLYFIASKDIVTPTWPGASYCSSPEEVKNVWTNCYYKYGEEKFFACEHDYMNKNFYQVIKEKIKPYIDLDFASRALQECFWSWSIHRGPGGAYNEFMMAIQHKNIANMSQEALFDTLYDMRYKQCPFTRYQRNAGTSSERESLRSLINTPGFEVSEITSPNRIIAVGSGLKYSINNPPLVCMMTNSTCYKGTRPMTIKGILWHSTGCNNPELRRYVQPSRDDPDYVKLIATLGKNQYDTDWNHIERQAGLNAWIGKLANGEVATVQTMPWEYRPWGCGSGVNGSCNSGWIQFEICEDDLNDVNYFNTVYQEACELTAYLCQLFNIDPYGFVNVNGIKVPTILCHADSYTLGMGGNHADVTHWFPKYGKSMATVRADVATMLNIIAPTEQEQEEEEMTQEKFNEMMDNYLKQLASKTPSDWSKEARDWCEENGIIKGDENGNRMYKKFLTREEIATLLYRLHGQK